MIKGRLAIIGEIEIDGEQLTGAFIECSQKDLKSGRHLFGENVTITASQPAVQADADYEAIARRDFEREIYKQCDKEDRERNA